MSFFFLPFSFPFVFFSFPCFFFCGNWPFLFEGVGIGTSFSVLFVGLLMLLGARFGPSFLWLVWAFLSPGENWPCLLVVGGSPFLLGGGCLFLLAVGASTSLFGVESWPFLGVAPFVLWSGVVGPYFSRFGVDPTFSGCGCWPLQEKKEDIYVCEK